MWRFQLKPNQGLKPSKPSSPRPFASSLALPSPFLLFCLQTLHKSVSFFSTELFSSAQSFLMSFQNSADSSSPALPFGCGLQPSPHWLFGSFPWIPCPRGSGESLCCHRYPCLQRRKLVEFWRALGCQLLGTKKKQEQSSVRHQPPKNPDLPKKNPHLIHFAQRAPNFR